MKKVLFWTLAITLVVSFSFFAAGCKGQVAETTIGETTVAATTVAGTTAEATTEAKVDQIDPWILGVREPYMKYLGDLSPTFKGPNGQTVTWSKDSLVLTESEVKKIQEGNYKVAVAWHVQSGDYIAAWRQGIIDTCKYLNLNIVAETDANYDTGKQKSDIETIIALKPDVIISVPIDAVSSAEAYRPAIDAGIKIALASNQPQDYVKGKDYIGITTANCYDRGITAAKLIGDLIGEKSKVALVTWSVDYWFTKFSDDLVRSYLKDNYPDMQVVADEQFVNWEEAGGVAAAILQQHPDVEGFYTTYVSSALPIASALVDANKKDIKVITNDIDEPTLVNMVSGGNIVGAGEDMTYNIGVDCAILAAYGILGKDGPEYAVGPIMPVMKDNIRQAWEITKHTPIPAGLEEALKKAGL